ncbi:hypothetical protein [Pseudarthrobacter raffinosi]|uniref:hypothetical protein n=1 Tax=Pseudarthrobacter raffinosi TaxID=2953651 RepID=UPI00208E6037|nr:MULTISPECIES: hypothetical protein [unclassified Pseudarthrobacter]MCO4239210.1 hypothetical protein [Pseudarthrobacter sp. MDT3-28]MCO4265210.1 hypothetical protein [Pseudarthrobacter sp. MDT3-26]
MTGTVIALMVLLLSLGATYFFCVRPMRKGSCAMGQTVSGSGTACQDPAAAEEAARLKAEITALRTQSAMPETK